MKICVICGSDVSGQKRTKDAEGRYYCAACWQAHSQGVYAVPAQEANSAVSEARTGRHRAVFVGVAMIACAIVAALIYSLLTHETWDSENRERILAMKRDAERLVASGQHETAQQKYHELLLLVSDREIKDRVLLDEVNGARREVKRIESEIVAKEDARRQERARQDAEARRREAQRLAQLAEERRQTEAEVKKQAADERKRAADRAVAERLAAEEAEAKQAVKRAAQARIELFRNDPATSYRAFCDLFLKELNKTDDVAIYNPHLSRNQTNRVRLANDQYTIDLQKTNSMLSPYVGTVDVSLQIMVNGQPNGIERYRFIFGAEEGKWVFKSCGSWSGPGIDGGYKLITDRTEWMAKIVAAAFENVPNP